MTLNELFKDLPQELRDRFTTDDVFNHIAHLACQKNWDERQFLIGALELYTTYVDALKKAYVENLSQRCQPIVITKEGPALHPQAEYGVLIGGDPTLWAEADRICREAGY